jgi:hypothetical protein
MIHEGIELKPIPGFQDYYASSDGNIWSMRPNNYTGWKRPTKPTKLKGSPNPKNGYCHVGLYRDGQCKQFFVSYIILTVFVSPRPDGHFACHGPNGKLDNSVGNLYWGTPKQNTADRVRDNTDIRGSDVLQSRLTAKDVKRIRKLYSNRGVHGIDSVKLSKIYGVNHTTILRAIKGITWAHI